MAQDAVIFERNPQDRRALHDNGVAARAHDDTPSMALCQHRAAPRIACAPVGALPGSPVDGVLPADAVRRLWGAGDDRTPGLPQRMPSSCD